MTSWDYSFVHKTKLFHGRLALEQIPVELEQKSARNPLVITQGNIPGRKVKTLVNAFSKFLNRINIYGRVPSVVEEESIHEIAGIYNETGADCILALGEGSVIETGKAVNILVSKDGANLRNLQGRDTLSGTMRPLFAIPTRAQSGFSINKSLQVDSGNDSYFLVSTLLMPTAVVTDPRMMLAGSKQEIAKSILASLFKAIEAATGPDRNPTSKAFAHSCLDSLGNELNDSLENIKNKELQARIVNANVLSDMAISNTSHGLGFAISRTITDKGNIPGDIPTGLMLPEIMKIRAKESESQEMMARLLLPLAGPEVYASTPSSDRPRETIKKVESLIAYLREAGEEAFTLKNLGILSGNEDIARAVIRDAKTLGDETATEHQVMDVLNSVP